LSVKKDENLSEWYSEVLQKAEMADHAPVRGFMIIRPNAYSVWEEIQRYFDKVLAKKGVRNAYFPLLIPKSFFEKEAAHAEGFEPELAWIEGTGEEKEGDKLALRPTSETIMYDSYSKWVRSWRDLPLKINQWSNTIRWEVKQTKPFLRTREFLWQEGHCVFATEKEAIENRDEMIKEYAKMCEDLLALPSIVGKKSEMETFAGSKDTQTFEMIMPDGKALQSGTSHNLGQNFAKAFDVSYENENKEKKFAWQTSWGFSTRLIGAMIMVHGDDKGLVMPPRVARDKIVIVPIFNADNKKEVLSKANDVSKDLKKFGVIIDDREGYSPGWKFNEWEMKGIPLRIEIGPKDIEKKEVVLVRRDTGHKSSVGFDKAGKMAGEVLDKMQGDMFDKAKADLESRFDSAKSLDELNDKLKKGKFVKVYMKDSKEIEEIVQDKTDGATSRIIEQVDKAGVCIISGEKVNSLAWVAKSY
jgi:prolyl-tRNA synthetase